MYCAGFITSPVLLSLHGNELNLSDLLSLSGCGLIDRSLIIGRCRFLGAFAKIAKSISFVMSVRVSAWNNSAPTGRILFKFDI